MVTIRRTEGTGPTPGQPPKGPKIGPELKKNVALTQAVVEAAHVNCNRPTQFEGTGEYPQDPAQGAQSAYARTFLGG